MKLNLVKADPAGNITLFVLDRIDESLHGSIGNKLMSLDRFKAEQVGFIMDPVPGTDGHMRMSGGEFCGNATRAFGMMVAKQKGLTGKVPLLLSVSGCDAPVHVQVDTEAGTSYSEMPLPRFTGRRSVNGVEGTLVHLGGIAHFVVDSVAPDLAFFLEAEKMFADLQGLDAYGVMFYDPQKQRLTPLVKVPAAGSLFWEGSCGSGSLATAIALNVGKPDGAYVEQIIQPAGTVFATVVIRGGQVVETGIGGSVVLDAPVCYELG